MKLNRKGYLTIEIIFASVITFVIAFFLIDLTMKLVDVVNNAYADIVLTTDKSLIIKNVREYLSKDMSLNGNIQTVNCENDKKCIITMNNGNTATLSLSGNQLKYSGAGGAGIYSKEIHDSLSNISLSSSDESGYYNFKIFGENIFVDKNYEMNINVYNKSVPILAPSGTWYKGSTNKSEITKINFFNNYNEYETYINQTNYTKREEWPAAFTAGSNGLSSEIMCYINGTELSIVGNDTGKIYANQNAYSMFGGYAMTKENNFVSLQVIEGLELLDTSMVTNMFAFFYGCEKLKNIDLSSFDTSNVTNMAGFFTDCYMLESINLSSFNTLMVTDIRHMFSGCKNLKIIDISSLDITSKITNMRTLFQGCEQLNTIVWPDKIDTSNVKAMNNMFYNCYNLNDSSLKVLTKFNTSNVTTMAGMFYNCESVTVLDLNAFDTKNVINMNFMFSGCKGLKTLDLANFDTSKVIHMSSMFQRCSLLQSLNISSFDTSSVWEMVHMFMGCENLEVLDISSFNTNCVMFVRGMFFECMKLKTIYVSNGWYTDSILISDDMFTRNGLLEGGEGTRFDLDYIDKTYARIDGGQSLPGYFTYKANNLGANGLSNCPYSNTTEPIYLTSNDKESISIDAME